MEKNQKEGFIPYPIVKEELKENGFLHYPKGIWLWVKKLTKEAQTGVVLSQIATKNSDKIVLLKVKYNENNILRCPEDFFNILLCHSGMIGKFKWKSGKAVVVTNKIPATNIELIKIFKWKDAWNN